MKTKVYFSRASIAYPFIFFLFLCVGTYFARAENWYYQFWYTDIVLHVLSGAMFASLWLWFVYRRDRTLIRFETLTAVTFATFGSVLWEFWEFTSWRVLPQISAFYMPEIGDTLGDILCGIVGALIFMIYLYLRKGDKINSNE